MEVAFSEAFKRSFRKRIKGRSNLESIYWSKLTLFIADPFDSTLKTHKLSGNLNGLWSFTIEYDCRVVFFFTNKKPKKAIFIDIGTHDEVY